LYLGGVLPPNKQGFQTLLEPVNAHWSRIQQNSMFGQQPPTRYFHFCNYAYILSRKGAQTILEAIQKEGGYKTSADHMVCNRVATLKHYVLTPLVAKCYQDEDPKYQTSVFNNFNRVDQFDSDLWNNDDRFSPEEIQSALRTPMKETKLNLQEILVYARNPIQVVPTSQIYTIEPYTLNPVSQMESSWLEVCTGISFAAIPSLPATHIPLRRNPIFVVCKPHMEVYRAVFAAYEAAGCAFYTIHLSDEFLNDPIDWYTYKTCKGVLRNYVRQECISMKHVCTIPLGPYRTTKEIQNFEDRPILWSFFGTDWQGRQKLLEPWKQLQPHKAAFFASWNDSNQVSAESYSHTSLHSIFMPCPRGQHVETFRFWEALEHGAIPIYIRCQGDDLYYAFLTEYLPILSIPSWEHAVGTIQTLLQNKETLVQYRTTLLQKWLEWKSSLRVECCRVLGLTTSP